MHNYYKVETYITEGNELDPKDTIRYFAEIYRARNSREAAVMHDAADMEGENVEVLKQLRGRYLGTDIHGIARRVFWIEPTENSVLYLAHVVTEIIP